MHGCAADAPVAACLARQVWHNYAFDRHIFENEGISPLGFGGDTMHMARLWNSSRTGKGYSLEALTKDVDVMRDALDIEGADESLFRAKQSMKELFAKPNVRKDGSDGRLVRALSMAPSHACRLPAADAPRRAQLVMPNVTDLQTSPETRYAWIDYSTLDAQATWLLRESLECKLRNMPVDACKFLVAGGFKPCATMWDFYVANWLPFGELLVDMERNGMLVDREQLRVAEKLATEHKATAEGTFLAWAAKRCEDAQWMNVGSGSQVRARDAAAAAHTLSLTAAGGHASNRFVSCCTRACLARAAPSRWCRRSVSSRCPATIGSAGTRRVARAKRPRSSAPSRCAASCRRRSRPRC